MPQRRCRLSRQATLAPPRQSPHRFYLLRGIPINCQQCAIGHDDEGEAASADLTDGFAGHGGQFTFRDNRRPSLSDSTRLEIPDQQGLFAATKLPRSRNTLVNEPLRGVQLFWGLHGIPWVASETGRFC